LYPATLLKLFIVSKCFGVEIFGSLRYRITSSANRDTLTISLPICITFISSSCLIILARNSRTMLNSSGENGHPYCVPDFRGSGFSFSPLSMMLPIGLFYVAFIMFWYISSIPSFLRAFIMKWYWILSKDFSASIQMIKWFFVFLSINVLYYIYWFVYVEPSLHPWDEAYLVIVNDLSDQKRDS
jgi:hypothetical protein